MGRKRRKMRARSKQAHPHPLCHGGPSSWCKTRLLDGCSGYRLGPQWSPTSLPVIPACQTVGIIFFYGATWFTSVEAGKKFFSTEQETNQIRPTENSAPCGTHVKTNSSSE